MVNVILHTGKDQLVIWQSGGDGSKKKIYRFFNGVPALLDEKNEPEKSLVKYLKAQAIDGRPVFEVGDAQIRVDPEVKQVKSVMGIPEPEKQEFGRDKPVESDDGVETMPTVPTPSQSNKKSGKNR